MPMKRTNPLHDEDKHYRLVQRWADLLQQTDLPTPEPGIAYFCDHGRIETGSLGEDPVEQTLTLLEMGDVSRLESCVSDSDTAAELAEAVRTHPETFRTEVRIYCGYDWVTLSHPILPATEPGVASYEQSAAQFLAAFTTPAAGESMSMTELAETFACWYRNLVGGLIGPTWAGRALSACSIERDQNEVIDRTWAEGVSPE